MSAPQIYARAMEHHQAGRLQEAERLYQQILELDANQVDARYLLGLVALQTGREALAVEHFQKTLRLKPNFADAYKHLAMALRAQARRQPPLAPEPAESENGRGIALQNQGKFLEAMACYQNAVRLRPDFAEAYANLGIVLHGQGKPEEAAACWQKAIALKPDYGKAYNNLAVVLLERNRPEEAEICLRHGLGFKPDDADVLNNLGIALLNQGKLAEAAARLEQALQYRPDFAEAYANLGAALHKQGKLAEAGVSWEQALRLRPDFAEAHLNLGLLRLLQGDWERGWPGHEWRWQTKACPYPSRPIPKWDGSPLDGKTILLFAEQGLGDTIQFIRYAALLKARGATTVLECPPALSSLLARCPGVDRVISQGDPLPPCDLQAALVSLPMLCGTTPANIPAQVPYLAANPSRIEYWRDRLARVPGFKVGICWQGNPSNKNDRNRSVPLARFAPLVEIPEVRLVCLQRGVGGEQWDRFAGQWPTLDLPEEAEGPSQAWEESAALICGLDLVITVDTAVAHLAGALAAPVWVALPFIPDWRWQLQREDSPWYPSMRLFRQSRPGEWHDVFQRIRDALEKRLKR